MVFGSCSAMSPDHAGGDALRGVTKYVALEKWLIGQSLE